MMVVVKDVTSSSMQLMGLYRVLPVTWMRYGDLKSVKECFIKLLLFANFLFIQGNVIKINKYQLCLCSSLVF